MKSSVIIHTEYRGLTFEYEGRFYRVDTEDLDQGASDISDFLSVLGTTSYVKESF